MKLVIITFLEKHPSNSVRATATHFNIEPKQVKDWQSKKENLICVSPHIRKLNNRRPPKYSELENKIYAKALSKRAPYTTLYSNISEAKFSDKWINGFMTYHKLSNRRRTTVVQKLSEDLQPALQEFLSLVVYRRIQFDYPLALIGNMDEVLMSFDLPTNITIDDCSTNTVSLRTSGYEKSNYTIVLACIADETKLLPVIIFKLMNILRQIFPAENVWSHRGRTDLRSLLVLDLFKGYIEDTVKHRFFEKNTNLAVISGGCTSKLQLLDVAINKSFKAKHYYNDWLDNSILTYTKTGRIQYPAYNLVAQWIFQTWNDIDSNLI
ncbi:3973_t:CDS:2 [Scutellospora calospora]|uniref:3973_t:CDS:1 n=1 Tax=Scutellospora calospora TaxID=85575 RepID=A0ACA9KM99_9GLOM|nr:3973_t:CDS:2 [Scutellospora calospora]